METDEAVLSYRPRSSKLMGGALLPELDVFAHLLVLLRLLDNNQLDKVSWLCNPVCVMDPAMVPQAMECSTGLVSKFVTQNRRTLDTLSAKAFSYHSRVYELMGNLAGVRR